MTTVWLSPTTNTRCSTKSTLITNQPTNHRSPSIHHHHRMYYLSEQDRGQNKSSKNNKRSKQVQSSLSSSEKIFKILTHIYPTPKPHTTYYYTNPSPLHTRKSPGPPPHTQPRTESQEYPSWPHPTPNMYTTELNLIRDLLPPPPFHITTQHNTTQRIHKHNHSSSSIIPLRVQPVRSNHSHTIRNAQYTNHTSYTIYQPHSIHPDKWSRLLIQWSNDPTIQCSQINS